MLKKLYDWLFFAFLLVKTAANLRNIAKCDRLPV